MHFEASRIGNVTPLPLPLPRRPVAPSDASSEARFARVYDMAVERERRTPPPEVLAEVAEAARLYSELDAAGLQVRFALAQHGVSASLQDRHGSLVRPLSLAEVMDPSSLLPPDAAA